MTDKAKAEQIVSSSGWLLHQPEAFRAEVLRRSILLKFAPDEAVYRVGDELGGIYGLVSGTVAIRIAPSMAMPLLVHLGVPGMWTGEGCFISRQLRRLEMRAVDEVWMLHLPLDAMDQIAAKMTEATLCFSNILMMSVDVLIRIIHDLQKPDAARRIASVLQRSGRIGDQPIRLSQVELGAMANASRKQVNAALKRFAEKGWVSHTYRSIKITDADALRHFADQED